MVARPMARPLALLALAASLALAACGGGAGGSASTAVATSETTTSTTPQGCRKVSSPPSHGAQRQRPPSTRLDPRRTYTVTMRTSCGTIAIRLDVARAPVTTASFASLVSRGFYDHLIFFRIARGFVIQGGDPLDNGTGGPGYVTVEAPPASLRYVRGVVAMAKGAQEAPGTAGSQFFIVTGDASQLPPDYALVGRVDGAASLATVDRIAATPADADERATRTVLIERAVLERSAQKSVGSGSGAASRQAGPS
jgi:cyclophilin family peptidyl-prolyl cis-trans isomerase